jgi:hypothetical protein
MEFIGTNFAITLGSWRLRIGFAIEDVTESNDDDYTTKPLRYAGRSNEKPSFVNLKR